MPIFEFMCPDNHLEEVFVRSDKDAPHHCRKCGKPLTKLISAPASQFPGASNWRDEVAGPKTAVDGSGTAKTESKNG